jgi:CubicO group peptidase (beta-lactamase class C family)
MTDAQRRPLELSAALSAATSAVQAGQLPCVVFGVSDARATLALHAVPPLRGRAVRTDSLFFLASVTKPIVASAVMQLVEDGLLDLHEPVQRHIPELEGPGKERVTAWHVLTHTSGLPDLPFEVLRRERPGYQRLVRKVCEEELAFEPGSRWAYGSDSFYILAELIARLRGLPFAAALERHVLAPLGMTETTFDPRGRRRRIALVHGIPMRNPLIRELLLRFLARATLPGGGLFGIAEDVLRFGRAMLPQPAGPGTRRILSERAIAEMMREHTRGIPRLDADGELGGEGRCGLGWRMAPRDAPGSDGAVTHGGMSGTRLWVDPKAGLAFVFLSNLWGAPDEPAWEVLRAVYDAWPPRA